MCRKNDRGEARLTAQRLVLQIQDEYRMLAEESTARASSTKGASKLFAGWFRSGAQAGADPLYEGFLTSVKSLVDQLAQALRELDQADERSACARAVANVMLASKPLNHKAAHEWYMVAAEYSFSPLLPFLSADELRRLMREYTQNVPKSKMYPRQRELFRLMRIQAGTSE